MQKRLAVRNKVPDMNYELTCNGRRWVDGEARAASHIQRKKCVILLCMKYDMIQSMTHAFCGWIRTVVGFRLVPLQHNNELMIAWSPLFIVQFANPNNIMLGERSLPFFVGFPWDVYWSLHETRMRVHESEPSSFRSNRAVFSMEEKRNESTVRIHVTNKQKHTERCTIFSFLFVMHCVAWDAQLHCWWSVTCVFPSDHVKGCSDRSIDQSGRNVSDAINITGVDCMHSLFRSWQLQRQVSSIIVDNAWNFSQFRFKLSFFLPPLLLLPRLRFNIINQETLNRNTRVV